MARLEITNLTKTLGHAPLLNGVTLDVERGETVAIYGRSGCGKSILLGILSGALSADDGDIRIDGRSIIDAPPENRHIGMAFQNFALYPHMNAFGNIASPLHGRQISREDIHERVKATAKLLKIDKVLSHFPQELSNGQRQRTSLARALVAEPLVLLLDDPLRNVDAKLRYEMRLEMPDLFRRFGASVIYVTQDSREAMALADRIAILHNGRLIQIGTPEEVYEFPSTAEVGRLLGDPTINLFPCRTNARDGSLFINPGKCSVNITGRYDIPENRAYIAGVRPEDVNISMSPGVNEYFIKATIKSVTPSNIRSLLAIRTATDEEIFSSCPEQEVDRYAVGKKVYVSFSAKKILLFSPDDEQLIKQNPLY